MLTKPPNERHHQIDSTEVYLDKLIKIYPNDAYFTKRYARFLFENSRNIKLANKLTKQYMSLEGAKEDHYTPFLMAHSFVTESAKRKEKLDELIEC